MKTIAIIPARAGSKRLPGKNYLPLNNIPLIEYSINYAKNNREIIDEIYVSTNDEEIIKIATKNNVKCITRPTEISGDNEPTVSALKHVLQIINEEIENVILLQVTNPLRPKNLLKDCFEKFKKSNVQSLFTVSRNHQKLGKINQQKFIPFNYTIGQRSQDLEPLFFENGLLYISKASLILKNEIISEDAFPYEVSHPFAQIDIDTKEDFNLAELFLKQYEG